MTSYSIYKFKKKLLYNGENFSYTKADLLSYSMFKLNIIGLRLVWNGLIFSDDMPVDNQLVTFLLESNIDETKIWDKN